MELRKVGIALYTVNKFAKQIRDLRELLKKKLFDREDCYSEFVELPEEIRKLSEKMNLEFSSIEIDGRDYVAITNMEEEEIENKLEEGFQELLCEFVPESEAERSDDDLMNVLSSMTIESDISEAGWSFTEDQFNEIEYWQEEFLKDLNNLHALRESTDKDHALVKFDLPEIMNALYELKTAVLLSLGIEPIAYHRLRNSTDTILAYYDVDGFGFHLPTMHSEEIEELIDNDKEICKISSENKLLPEEYMTSEEAINYLLALINKSSISAEEILNGATGWSGFKTIKPKYDKVENYECYLEDLIYLEDEFEDDQYSV